MVLGMVAFLDKAYYHSMIILLSYEKVIRSMGMMANQ